MSQTPTIDDGEDVGVLDNPGTIQDLETASRLGGPWLLGLPQPSGSCLESVIGNYGLVFSAGPWQSQAEQQHLVEPTNSLGHLEPPLGAHLGHRMGPLGSISALHFETAHTQL